MRAEISLPGFAAEENAEEDLECSDEERVKMRWNPNLAGAFCGGRSSRSPALQLTDELDAQTDGNSSIREIEKLCSLCDTRKSVARLSLLALVEQS